MPTFTPEQLTGAIAASGVLAVVAVVVSVKLALRVHRLRREYALLRGDRGAHDIFSILGRTLERMDAMEHRVDEVVADQQEVSAIGRYALSKFAVVRYDAFPDMGGQMSFSAAFVDENGDGLVITSINGRTETRTYAKALRGLSSSHNLSQEEREAIGQAVAGHGRGDVQPASFPAR